MDVCFKWNKKNTYSLAVLVPLIPESSIVKKPQEGIMIYSFATRQKEEVFREVDNSPQGNISIAGGPHPSGAVEETLEHFDYVVVGEGEQALVELVDVLCLGGDVSAVKGIAYVDESESSKGPGKVVYTGSRPPVDLDLYPCFDPEGIRCPIEISRGCPRGCKYCQTPRLFGRRMRHRSIESICRFAKHYSDLRFTSSNAFAYGGDGIRPEFDKVEKLLSALYDPDKKKIYFGTFPSEVRPEFVTEKSLDLIDKYCTNRILSMGAQSGSDRILSKIRRGHTVDDVIGAVELCREHELTPVVDFIFGFPDETEEDQELSLDLIKWINRKKGNIRAHYLTPLPGTPYENVIPSQVSEHVNKVLGRMARDGIVKGVWES